MLHYVIDSLDMDNTNAVRIGRVINIRTHGDLATYTLNTGYEWEDAAGVFSKGECVRVTPYILQLVHIERHDN